MSGWGGFWGDPWGDTAGVVSKRGAGAVRAYAAGKQLHSGVTMKTGAGVARLASAGADAATLTKHGAATGRWYGAGFARAAITAGGVGILHDATVAVNGVDLSSHVEALTVSVHTDLIDITPQGSPVFMGAAGLRTDTFQLVFLQDFGLASVNSVLESVKSSSGFPVVCKPHSGAVSPTNPAYSATCVLRAYDPVAGKVGDAAFVTVDLLAVTPIAQITS